MNTSNTDSNALAPVDAVRYTSNMRSIELLFDPTPDPRSTAMSVAFAEPVLGRPVTDRAVLGQGGQGGAPAPVLRLVPTAPAVPGRIRRPGPGVGPTARPRRLRFSAPAAVAAPRACRPPAATVSPSRTWHLTERGLALVLVVAAALVVASVTVVGLTALRVTSEGYQPGHSAAAPVLVDR